MPIYEYQCFACGKALDVLQKMTDPPLQKCPECGGRLKKQISLPTVNTVSKARVMPSLSPRVSHMMGSSAIDGTRPLDWPRGRLVGELPESQETK